MASGRNRPQAALCLNYDNPLVRRMARARDAAKLKCALQMLYVQALLMGHRQLNAAEMALLSESLMGLLQMELGAEGG